MGEATALVSLVRHQLPAASHTQSENLSAQFLGLGALTLILKNQGKSSLSWLMKRFPCLAWLHFLASMASYNCTAQINWESFFTQSLSYFASKSLSTVQRPGKSSFNNAISRGGHSVLSSGVPLNICFYCRLGFQIYSLVTFFTWADLTEAIVASFVLKFNELKL